MVMQFATTSKSGSGIRRAATQFSTHVPRLRVIPTPCLKAPSEGAVIKTPCAPPLVPVFTAAMGSPALGIDDKIGAEPFGVGELAVIHVNRANVKPHDLGVLNRQMSQAADTGNRNPLAGLSRPFP